MQSETFNSIAIIAILAWAFWKWRKNPDEAPVVHVNPVLEEITALQQANTALASSSVRASVHLGEVYSKYAEYKRTSVRRIDALTRELATMKMEQAGIAQSLVSAARFLGIPYRNVSPESLAHTLSEIITTQGSPSGVTHDHRHMWE